MANGSGFRLGGGTLLDTSARDRARELELLKFVDELIAVRAMGLIVEVVRLVLTKFPSLLKASNEGLDNGDLALSAANISGAVDSLCVIQCRPDKTNIIAGMYSNAKMEFDNQVQDVFEALLKTVQDETVVGGSALDKFAGRFVTNLKKMASRKIDGDSVFKEFGVELKNLIGKESSQEALGLIVDDRLKMYCKKALRKYGYRRCGISTEVNLVNMGEGKDRKIVYECCAEVRPDCSQEVISLKSGHARLPFVSLQNWNVAEVSCRVTYSTGVRELIKKAMDAYEDAAPMEKIGGARYGKIGEKIGGKADDLVLHVLSQKFRAEEPEVNTPSNTVLLHDGNAKAVAAAIKAENRDAIVVKPYGAGSVNLKCGGVDLPLVRLV